MGYIALKLLSGIDFFVLINKVGEDLTTQIKKKYALL
jgi:hypothetical protein